MLLGSVLDQDVEEWERMIAVNQNGLLYMTKAALPHLLAAAEDELRGVADIVNISSIAGRQAWANFAAYNMTKFGVNGFTEALRQEITKKHVRVGVLEPGAVETELISHNNDTIKGPPRRLRREEHPREAAAGRHRREHRVHGDPPPPILHCRAVGHAHVPGLRTAPKENTA